MFGWFSSGKKQKIEVNGFDLSMLNRGINKQIWYTKDKNNELKVGFDLKEGDCEDYAATKALFLEKFNKENPYKVIKWRPFLCKKHGIWHMILQVEGKFYLDNFEDTVYESKDFKRLGISSASSEPATIATQIYYEKIFKQEIDKILKLR